MRTSYCSDSTRRTEIFTPSSAQVRCMASARFSSSTVAHQHLEGERRAGRRVDQRVALALVAGRLQDLERLAQALRSVPLPSLTGGA